MNNIYIILLFLILFVILDCLNNKSKILELHKEAFLVYNKEVEKEIPSPECGPCRRCPPSAPPKICPEIDMKLYMPEKDKTICPEIIISEWIDKKEYKEIKLFMETIKERIDKLKKNINNILESRKKLKENNLKKRKETVIYWDSQVKFLENLEEIVTKEYLNADIEFKKIHEIISLNKDEKKCFLDKNFSKNIIEELSKELYYAKNILINIKKIKIEASENFIRIKKKEKEEEKKRIAAEAARIKAEEEAEIARKKAEEAAKLAKIRAEKLAELEKKKYSVPAHILPVKGYSVANVWPPPWTSSNFTLVASIQLINNISPNSHIFLMTHNGPRSFVWTISNEYGMSLRNHNNVLQPYSNERNNGRPGNKLSTEIAVTYARIHQGSKEYSIDIKNGIISKKYNNITNGFDYSPHGIESIGYSNQIPVIIHNYLIYTRLLTNEELININNNIIPSGAIHHWFSSSNPLIDKGLNRKNLTVRLSEYNLLDNPKIIYRTNKGSEDLPNPDCIINTPCTYKGATHTCDARWKWLTNKKGKSDKEAAEKIKDECLGKCDCTAANYNVKNAFPPPATRPIRVRTGIGKNGWGSITTSFSSISNDIWGYWYHDNPAHYGNSGVVVENPKNNWRKNNKYGDSAFGSLGYGPNLTLYEVHGDSSVIVKAHRATGWTHPKKLALAFYKISTPHTKFTLPGESKENLSNAEFYGRLYNTNDSITLTNGYYVSYYEWGNRQIFVRLTYKNWPTNRNTIIPKGQISEYKINKNEIIKEKEEKKQFVKGDWFWPANNNSVPHFYKRGIGLYAQRFGGWGGNDPMYNNKWRQWIIDSSDNETLFLMTNWAPRFKSHNLTTWSPPLDFLVPYRGKGASFYGQKDASNNEGQYFVSGNIYIKSRWCHTYWVSAKGYIFQLSNKSINNFRWGMGFSLSATVSRVYCNKSGVRGESNLTKYLKKAIFRFTGYNSRGDMFNKTNGTLLLEVHGTSWMKGWNTFTTSGKYSHIDYEKISNDNISGELNIPVIIYGQ